jgi:hypothetical protein
VKNTVIAAGVLLLAVLQGCGYQEELPFLEDAEIHAYIKPAFIYFLDPQLASQLSDRGTIQLISSGENFLLRLNPNVLAPNIPLLPLVQPEARQAQNGVVVISDEARGTQFAFASSTRSEIYAAAGPQPDEFLHRSVMLHPLQIFTWDDTQLVFEARIKSLPEYSPNAFKQLFKPGFENIRIQIRQSALSELFMEIRIQAENRLARRFYRNGIRIELGKYTSIDDTQIEMKDDALIFKNIPFVQEFADELRAALANTLDSSLY